MPLSSTSPTISSSFLTKQEKEKLQLLISIIFYILLGFITYLIYSVSNRKACEFFPVPFFISFFQLFFTSFIFFFLSFLLSLLPSSLLGQYYQPNTSSLPLAYHNYHHTLIYNQFFSFFTVIKKVSQQTLLLTGICYTIHHLLNFYTIHTGLISHLHFFMGIEPFTLLFLTQWFLPSLTINQHSIIAIVIIIFGTIFAHMKHHFNVTNFHFFTCLLSSFCYQIYLIQVKTIHITQSKEKERFSLITFLAVITMISASILFPLAYYLEYHRVYKYMNRYLIHESDRLFVLENLLISTVTLTISTYCNAAALELVYPVTFSVGNSLIRLIVSMVSVVVSVYHRVNLLEYLGMIVSFVGYWIFYKTI